MKNKKVLIATLVMSSILSTSTSILAVDEQTNTNTINVVENQDAITTAYEELKSNIIIKYGDNYTFDNFSYNITDVRVTDDSVLYDINILTEMTLARKISEGTYAALLYSEAMLIEDETVKNKVTNYIDSYLESIDQECYNIPNSTCFKYTIRIPSDNTLSVSASKIDHYQLLYRTDIDSDTIVNNPINKVVDKSSADSKVAENAENFISDIISLISSPTLAATTVTYNRLDARDYALEHATDEPEFSREDEQSDCANFVSKAIHAGGIPIDYPGKWYPSSDGTINTCGDNWMRTGYWDNGGVVPYMEDKNYFYEQTNENRVNAGSIMYWNNDSHVALVTYGDTVTIKYTEHSDVQLSEEDSTNIVYEDDVLDVKFYMPYASILAEEY